MKFEIKNRWKGSVIFAIETETFRLAVEAALKSGADLRGADLRGADLRGAVLSDADLSGAVLSGAVLSGAVLSSAVLSSADLRGAVLSSADLRGADLRGAFLRGAVLRGAVLSGAVLSGAVLRGADLSSADLRGADLSSADLSDADLTSIRDDLWAVLSAAPREAEGLRLALIEGRVDGSTYEGACACLVGTIANVRHESYQNLGVLKPDSNRPIERFFYGISEGDTPENNQFSKIALEWVDQWLAAMRGAFGSAPAA